MCEEERKEGEVSCERHGECNVQEPTAGCTIHCKYYKWDGETKPTTVKSMDDAKAFAAAAGAEVVEETLEERRLRTDRLLSGFMSAAAGYMPANVMDDFDRRQQMVDEARGMMSGRRRRPASVLDQYGKKNDPELAKQFKKKKFRKE